MIIFFDRKVNLHDHVVKVEPWTAEEAGRKRKSGLAELSWSHVDTCVSRCGAQRSFLWLKFEFSLTWSEARFKKIYEQFFFHLFYF